MTLMLDKRKRAMLREMGIRLWQPLPREDSLSAKPVQSEQAAKLAAKAGQQSSALAPRDALLIAPQSAPRQALASSAKPSPLSAQALSAAGASPWTLTSAQLAFPLTESSGSGPGSTWLVLVETPLTLADPLAGEAAKLLRNMLRAAGLQNHKAVWLAGASRGSAPTAGQESELALAALIQELQPEKLLIMGRLAAQALLQTAEPLGKLRGKVHQLHGVATMVMYDPTWLLRNLPDKAKAWDDLCFATASSD